MTRRSNARVAGFAFLVYIAAAFGGMILEGKASGGEGPAAKLASIAQHAGAMRLAILLHLVGCFCALVLAVTLYAITRDRDQDVALLAMACRIAEGVIGALSLPRMRRRSFRAWALLACPTADNGNPAICISVDVEESALHPARARTLSVAKEMTAP